MSPVIAHPQRSGATPKKKAADCNLSGGPQIQMTPGGVADHQDDPADGRNAASRKRMRTDDGAPPTSRHTPAG